MAWDASEPAAATDFLVAVGYIRDNNAALEAVLTSTRLLAGTNIPELFPLYNQCPMLFYMASAPTGWTETADMGDQLVSVKGGTTYTQGGATKGSWQSPNYTLTSADIPAHTHTYSLANYSVTGRRTGGSTLVTTVSALQNTSSAGGGGAHNHGTTWRPAGRTCIMATKD